MTPGMAPPRKSRPTEVSVAAAKMMNAIDGGMSGPMVAAPAMIDAA